ncbi:MAG: hypothetical protein GTO22_26745, partial [Gemmatimonadales bacterium]|nr:hypothetical protein [Gemmatimonadales bacterium]
MIVYDLQQGTNTTLTDGAPDYAPGHSDNGQGTCLGYENWANRYLLRDLATPHSYSVVYDWGSNWGHGEHISFLADDEGWFALSTYEANGSPPP